MFLSFAWELLWAHWIRPRTLNREVPGSNLLGAAGVLQDNALYPHCAWSLENDLKPLVKGWMAGEEVKSNQMWFHVQTV